MIEERIPFRVLGVSAVFHNRWIESGSYDFALQLTDEPFVRIEYSTRPGYYWLYNDVDEIVTGDAVTANTRVSIYLKSNSLPELRKRFDAIAKDLEEINQLLKTIEALLGAGKAGR